MHRRLRRVLLRLVLVALVLGVLGLVAFTWLAFWPLEGNVDRIASLVPDEVDFVYRASWNGLRRTGWVQENVEEHPVVPQLEDAVRSLRTITQQLEDAERQINDAIPLGITTFSFEEDVFGGEVVAAGRFCEGWDPERGPPTWREILLLTRISWKPKFFSALKHGFVRAQLEPDVTVEDLGDGLFKFILNTVVPSPVRARSGCGPGIVMPPENVWYGRRVKDVLVFGNTQALMRDVPPKSGRSYLDRPRVRLDAPSNAVAASIVLQPLQQYMVQGLEVIGSPLTILQRYLTVTALDRMNGQLILPSRDMVVGRADVRYHPSRLADGIRDVYALPAEPLGTSVASLLPAEDTFGALLLRTPPLQLIRGIYEDLLGPGDRKLWRDNLRRMGRYESIDEFFAEFSEKLSDTAAIAVGRMSDLYDTMTFPGFFLPPGASPADYPDPNWPAVAMMVRLRRDTLPEELDAYLAERVALLGGSSELEKVTYRGLTYTRVRLEVQAADYLVVQPAYILAQDHFIFSSNESYFRKILDTIVDPTESPPLASDATFRGTMDHLPERSHVVVFLDLEKLFATPTPGGSGPATRGFLWDQRRIWVVQNRNPRQEAIRFRRELIAEHRQRTGREPTAQQMGEIERRVDALWEDWSGRYVEFEEEYADLLRRYQRLRAFGAGIVAERPTLRARFAVLFLRPGPAGREAEDR